MGSPEASASPVWQVHFSNRTPLAHGWHFQVSDRRRLKTNLLTAQVMSPAETGERRRRTRRTRAGAAVLRRADRLTPVFASICSRTS